MEYFDVVGERRSIRRFHPTPVEQEKVDAILDAAVNLAPSAGNLQSYRVYLVRTPSARQRLRTAARDREYITGAAMVLVFCTDAKPVVEKYGDRGHRYSVQDATIACTFAMLAATALGLGSVPVGAFDDESVRQAIGAPEGIVPVLLLPVGYPAESPEPRPRRPMTDLVQEVAG